MVTVIDQPPGEAFGPGMDKVPVKARYVLVIRNLPKKTQEQ
jgi:hypothetical protein